MVPIKIIGVPEHFNMPWHFALEEGAFAERGIDLTWQDVPEGTGRMCQLLESGDADLAVILTEGLCKAIHEGLEAKIVQQYIASPLLWGVHVAGASAFRNPAELEGGVAAISRPGSGSHLMAFVWSREMGWNTNDLEFLRVNTLEGAVTALTEGKADFFMWERFTTQPYVDSGVFRRLADCPTPWPCFVIAASQSVLKQHADIISHIVEVINRYTLEFRQIPSIDRTFSNRYGIELDDIRQWLLHTRWSQEQIDHEVLQNVITSLFDLKLISKPMKPKDLCWIR